MARRERSFFFNNKTGELKSKGKTLVDATNSDNIAQTKGSTTGNPVALIAEGDDTNIDIRITPKGSGNVEILAPLEILTGKRILDSAGTNVEFGDNIEMNSNLITGVGTPSASTDAATKGYVDTTAAAGYLPLTGGTISSNLTVSGNFTVNGTTTTINTSTLSVADNLIDLNSDVTSGTPSQDAGIRILRGDSNAVQLRWNETNDKWELTTDGASYTNIAVTSDIPTAVSELTNDSGYSTTTGTVTSVAGTGTVNGLTLSGTVTSSGSLTLGGTFTATVSEISDLTATAAELNLLDGVTATTTEINYLDGVTSAIQTQIDNISSSFTLAADSGTSDTFTTGQTLTIAGGTGVDTTVTDNQISVAIDSTVATLTGSQTLTNKTLTSPSVNTEAKMLAQAELEFYDSDSSNYVSFRGPATVASNITWTLPNTDGTEDQVLSTNGAGTLAWADAGSGGGGSGSSYPNSTFSTVPGTDGNFDMSYNVAQTSQETPFEAGGTDAFGVNLGSVFSLMDPIGSIESIDYGDSEAYVGA